jgi:hypothetical protein
VALVSELTTSHTFLKQRLIYLDKHHARMSIYGLGLNFLCTSNVHYVNAYEHKGHIGDVSFF